MIFFNMDAINSPLGASRTPFCKVLIKRKQQSNELNDEVTFLHRPCLVFCLNGLLCCEMFVTFFETTR
jgi:hypothetical protein